MKATAGELGGVYPVQPRRPDRRYAIAPCVNCGGTVERWAAPLDVRVSPLCDRCQRKTALT